MVTLPFTSNIETVLKKYDVLFSMIVLYQGLFGGLSISGPPQRLAGLGENMIFKIVTMICIAFTATKDIETSLLAVVLFLGVMYAIKTPSERKEDGFVNV
jgi:hypothetical protein